jgi:hypothetical protein
MKVISMRFNEIILIGAGGSIEAGIPDAYRMTEVILNKFKDYSTQYRSDIYERVVNFVIGGLLFQKGVKGQNPLEYKVDIEEFFNAILLLADRDSTELAPFVGSWHYIIEELDKIQPSSRGLRRFIDKIHDSFRSPSRLPSSFQLESSFRRAIEESQHKPGRGSIFREVSKIMISMLHDLIWIKDFEKIKYLEPLMKKVKNDTVVIATVNYDNTIELASQFYGISCDTLLDEGGKLSGLLNLKNLNLLKLHGSIDWQWIFDNYKPNYSYTIKKAKKLSADEITHGNIMPAIIFGKSKLTTEGPFLQLLNIFRSVLNESNLLTIIGYSFRDDHINTCITQWLDRNEDNIMRIIDPGFNDSKIPYAAYLNNLKEKNQDKIKIFSEPAGIGLKMLYNGDLN